MTTARPQDRTDLPASVGAEYAAPRVTRLLAAMWTVHAVADFAQLGYAAAEDRA